MKQIINITLEQNFLSTLTLEASRITSGFNNQQDIIVFSHRRLQKAFINQSVFIEKRKYLPPRCITFSSIVENIPFFAPFCLNISRILQIKAKERLVSNEKLSAILQIVLMQIKKSSLLCNSTAIDKVDISKLKRAVLEYYHYNYKKEKIFPYSLSEKLLLYVVKYLEEYLLEKKLTFHARQSSFIIDALLTQWDYKSKRKILMVLPQTDSSYINKMTNNVTNFRKAFVFIRGFCENINRDTVMHNSYHYHISHFLHRNNLSGQDIKNTDGHLPNDENILLYFQRKYDLDSKCNVLVAKDQHEEASLIALVIKEKLHQKINKIYVQTNSRSLSVLIESCLQRWNIRVDNLLTDKSRSGQLYLMILRYLSLAKPDFHLLLDILKHNNSCFANTELPVLFELQCLRKYPCKESLQEYLPHTSHVGLGIFIATLHKQLDEVRYKLKNSSTLKDFSKVIMCLYKFLATQIDVEILELEKTIELISNSTLMGFGIYSKIIQHILSEKTLIQEQEDYSVKIMQIFESRGLHMPFIIFAGLNEGIFPTDDYDHHFIHTYTRQASKLRKPEIEIGYMQYDFINAISINDVVLSCTENVQNKMRKNRWLEIITGNNNEKSRVFTQKYRQIKQLLINKKNHYEDELPVFFPKKDSISVSEIEVLMNNPYVYYCRYLLKLSYLEPIARSIKQSDFGKLIHKLLFLLPIPSKNFIDYQKKFNNTFLYLIKRYGFPSMFITLWQSRIDNICKNIYRYYLNTNNSSFYREIKGAAKIQTSNTVISLNCRADLITVSTQGIMHVIDYKSGRLPSLSKIRQGLSPQLIIEAIILQKDGFQGIRVCKDKALVLKYIDVSGRTTARCVKEVPYVNCEADLRELLYLFFGTGSSFFSPKERCGTQGYPAYNHVLRRPHS